MKFFLIEIFYPVFLSLFFFFMFTSLVYEGSHEMQIASMIESQLFEFARNFSNLERHLTLDDLSSVSLQYQSIIYLCFVFFYFFGIVSFEFSIALFLFLFFILFIFTGSIYYLKITHIYFPIFHILYGSFWLVIISIFFKISIDTFQYWKIILQKEFEIKKTESKNNFLSLFSHNLNTPITKMSVLLNILYKNSSDHDSRKKMTNIFNDLANMQLAIRMLLVHTSIEDSRLNDEASTVHLLSQEFFKLINPSLLRMGLDVSVICSSEREDLVDVPLRFDRKVITTVLGALSIIISWFDDHKKCQIYLTVSEKEYEHNLFKQVLICECFSFQKSPNKILRYIVDQKDLSDEIPMLINLGINLIRSVKKHYDGQIFIHNDENHLTLLLEPRKI